MKRTVGLEPTTYRLDRFAVSIPKLERRTGFEPVTFCLASRCTTNCTNAALSKEKVLTKFWFGASLRRPGVTAPLYLSRLTWSDLAVNGLML